MLHMVSRPYSTSVPNFRVILPNNWNKTSVPIIEITFWRIVCLCLVYYVTLNRSTHYYETLLVGLTFFFTD